MSAAVFAFMKFKGKKKGQEVAKSDSDANYVDDGEDYANLEEYDDIDSISADEDNKPL